MLWAFVLPHLALAVTFSAQGHTPDRLKNATADELQAAIKLVDGVLEESAKRKVARLEHVRRNQYANCLGSCLQVHANSIVSDTNLRPTQTWA